MKKYMPILGLMALLPLEVICAQYKALDNFIMEAKLQTEFPSGTAVVIIKDGKIVFKKNYGYSDIAKKQAVDDDTLFYTASVTKPLFAMSTLLNQQAEGYDENITLRKMFPELMLNNIASTKITLRSLLSHTSGINNYNLTTVTAYTGIHSPLIINKLIDGSVEYKDHPLGHYRYSNTGYNIASAWMDQIFSQPWQTIMAESVFKPLNMHNTTASMSQAQNKNGKIALPYGIYNPEPLRPYYLSKQDNTLHAGGGVISTATDLSKYLIAVMNNGKLRENRCCLAP